MANMSFHISSKSVEGIIKPIREQVNQLLELQSNPSSSSKSVKMLPQIRQLIRQAVDQFATAGEFVAEENPKMKTDLLSACAEARQSGISFENELTCLEMSNFSVSSSPSSTSTLFGNHSSSSKNISTLSELSRHLLACITRVLLLVDEVTVQKVHRAREMVLMSLVRLESCTIFSEFMTEFNIYGNHMVKLGLLSGARQNDLLDECEYREMACIRSILERSTSMLLTCSKLHLRYPDSVHAQRLRSHLLQHIRETLHLLASVLNGSTFFDTYQTGQASIWILLDEMMNCNDKQACASLSEQLSTRLHEISALHATFHETTTTTNVIDLNNLQERRSSQQLNQVVVSGLLNEINKSCTQSTLSSNDQEINNSPRATPQQIRYLVERLQEEIFHPILSGCGDRLQSLLAADLCLPLKEALQPFHDCDECSMGKLLKNFEKESFVPLLQACRLLTEVAASKALSGVCAMLDMYAKTLFTMFSLAFRCYANLTEAAIAENNSPLFSKNILRRNASDVFHRASPQLRTTGGGGVGVGGGSSSGGVGGLLSSSIGSGSSLGGPSLPYRSISNDIIVPTTSSTTTTATTTSDSSPSISICPINTNHARVACEMFLDIWLQLFKDVMKARHDIVVQFHHHDASPSSRVNNTNANDGNVTNTITNHQQQNVTSTNLETQSTLAISSSSPSHLLPTMVSTSPNTNNNVSLLLHSLSRDGRNPPNSNIIQLERILSDLANNIYLFARGEGTLRTTQELFAYSHTFLVEATNFDKALVEFKEWAANVRPDLSYLNFTALMQAYTESLLSLHQFLTQPAIGKSAHFLKVDTVIMGVHACMNWVAEINNHMLSLLTRMESDLHRVGAISLQKRNSPLISRRPFNSYDEGTAS